MRTLCAWCEREGIETVLKDGSKDGPKSHGICERHQQKILDEITAHAQKKRETNPKRRRKSTLTRLRKLRGMQYWK